jgi:hypothetical protein
LKTDFAKRIPNLLWWPCAYLAAPIAFLLAASLVLTTTLPLWLRLALAIGLLVPLNVAVACVLYLIFQALLYLTSLRKKRRHDTAEAERFYWLAMWGAAHGKHKYSRRMLKLAQRCGYTSPHWI